MANSIPRLSRARVVARESNFFRALSLRRRSHSPIRSIGLPPEVRDQLRSRLEEIAHTLARLPSRGAVWDSLYESGMLPEVGGWRFQYRIDRDKLQARAIGLSALSTYGPRFLRSIPPRGARDVAGLITSPFAVQFAGRA